MRLPTVALLVTVGSALGCREPSAVDAFRKAHDGRGPDCALGGRYDDCAEIARLEKDPAKRAGWLELGCTHDRGDLCVELVGTSDYPAKDVDPTRAVALLTKGCLGVHPGRSCAELVYRRIPLIATFMGSSSGIDAESLGYAQRACWLGGGSLPLKDLGPSPCYFVGRAYNEGLAGRPKDPARAALFFEQACEQELELTRGNGGASCFYAARVLLDQPLLGPVLPDRTPLDEAKAKSLLQRGCANHQSDSCAALAPPRP